nr:transposase [Streptomyces xanthophaeus]
MAGGDLGGGKRARAACGGYVCFEDEAGFTRRPPRGRTWGRRGPTPVVTISGRRSGRLSVAGLIAMRPGSRTRLCHRLRTHPAGKGARRSMGERDFIELIDGVHQLVKAPIVLVWDRLNTHLSRRMRDLVAEREWLTVFLLPAYSPDLNPVEWVWAHVKRSLANLAVMALDRLEALVRNRLKRLQYRPDTLDGFIAGTGLTIHSSRRRRLQAESLPDLTWCGNSGPRAAVPAPACGGPGRGSSSAVTMLLWHLRCWSSMTRRSRIMR